ncbi:hypothetical protein [Nonomuraea sp. NPDC003804]|uniref:hypothetical protein n=1 Tax=Nonomuraea sp. NPDC003804 TaxID=3154547 RepID=UPI0033A67D8D
MKLSPGRMTCPRSTTVAQGGEDGGPVGLEALVELFGASLVFADQLEVEHVDAFGEVSGQGAGVDGGHG